MVKIALTHCTDSPGFFSQQSHEAANSGIMMTWKAQARRGIPVLPLIHLGTSVYGSVFPLEVPKISGDTPLKSLVLNRERKCYCLFMESDIRFI